MLLPAPGFVSLAQEVFPDSLSGTREALLLSITLWKLFSRQLGHLSKCSTWCLPVLHTQCFAASSPSLESLPSMGKVDLSGNESGLGHSPPCASAVTRTNSTCVISCFPCVFFCVQDDSGSMTKPKLRGSSDVLV